jgi:hypothetical protein
LKHKDKRKRIKLQGTGHQRSYPPSVQSYFLFTHFFSLSIYLSLPLAEPSFFASLFKLSSLLFLPCVSFSSLLFPLALFLYLIKSSLQYFFLFSAFQLSVIVQHQGRLKKQTGTGN